MKKLLIISVAVLSLTSCVSYHKGQSSILVEDAKVSVNPLQVDIKVGRKIQGSAQCIKLFGIPIKSPHNLAYGAILQTNEGNFTSDSCTNGAIYDAINNNNTDVIIAPQYATSKKSFLCLPLIGCLYSNYVITVTGFKGNYINIYIKKE